MSSCLSVVQADLPSSWWYSDSVPTVTPKLVQWAMHQPSNQYKEYPNVLWLVLALDRLGWDASSALARDVFAFPGFGPLWMDSDPHAANAVSSSRCPHMYAANASGRPGDSSGATTTPRANTRPVGTEPVVEHQEVHASSNSVRFRCHMNLRMAREVVQDAAIGFQFAWDRLNVSYHARLHTSSVSVLIERYGGAAAAAAAAEAAFHGKCARWNKRTTWSRCKISVTPSSIPFGMSCGRVSAWSWMPTTRTPALELNEGYRTWV